MNEGYLFLGYVSAVITEAEQCLAKDRRHLFH